MDSQERLDNSRDRRLKDEIVTDGRLKLTVF